MLKRLLILLLFPALLLAQAPKVTVTTRQATGAPLSFVQADKNFTDLQAAANASQRAWGQKESTTTGLTFGYYGGPAFNGTTWTSVGDGTITLAASQTNYVERTAAGVVSANTTGWSSGKVPLAMVVTGTSTITTVLDFRVGQMAEGISSINAALHFGLHPSNSEAANTTALNAAISAAIAGGRSLYIPGAGAANPYKLNALSAITSGVTIYGDGKATLLQFNTTSDCIRFNPAVSEQRENFTIRGIKFDNLTNVPASFIKNDYGLNVLVDRCYFNDAAATYCVDNWTGYGTIIKDCVFSDITGTAIRLRDNNAVPLYSFSTKIQNCDITRMSVDGVEIEGTGAGPVLISGTVVEGCGGIGVRCNTKAGGGFTWNLHLDGCYFELNTGFDISLNANGAGVVSYAKLTACVFGGTPTIDLGDKGKISIDTCTNSGGNVCAVSGSLNASAILTNSLNFSQSGTYAWSDDKDNSGDTPVSYTPVWGSSGTQPAIGNGSIVGKYVRKGRQITAHIRITAGSTTTFGTGNYYVSLPAAAAESGQIAQVLMLRTGTAYWTGWFATISGAVNHTIQTTSGGSTNAATNVTNSSPATWAANDVFDISLTYWI